MKLGNSNNVDSGRALNKIFRKRNVIFLLVICLLLGAYFASGKLRAKGYKGIWEFVSIVAGNYFEGRKAEPEQLSIEIKDKDFKKLEKLRKQALERGVIINDRDGDYVPAVLTHAGNKIDVKLRLKGHMTDHLQNNKWSFRIKTKGNDHFMGMKRFSIQHPGTRGYIYEWIYHELMRREDVIALRYKFINVKVNGNDWGIYCVEENFESELVENNGRIKAPILRYNPDLYWVNRYNMSLSESSFDEYASYYSANPEAYRESKILSDSIQKQYYLKAIALIEGLRSRKITVEQAFDIPRLAKYHAVIDLVGGLHSIDWSDVKYYYNPATARLEPVAYESFTNLNSHDISAAYKFVQPDSTANFTDWHQMIFSDSKFFAEYVKQLERMTQPAYFDAFFDSSNEELKKNLSIIYKEFPFKKFDRSLYYKRQKQLRKILDAPKSLHAYLSSSNSSELILQLASIDAFPVKVNSIVLGSHEIKPEKEILLPAKQAKKFIEYKSFSFKLPEGILLNDSLLSAIKIKYQLPGSSLKKEAIVFPFPHTDDEFVAAETKKKKGNVEAFDFLVVNEKEKIVFFKQGKVEISEDLIIPADYRILCDHRTTIDLLKGAGIISYSPISFKGLEDENLFISSSDSSGQGIKVIGAGGRCKFENVTFNNMPPVKDASWKRNAYLVFYESPVSFTQCSFYKSNSGAAVSIIRSDYSFNACYFGRMQNALELNASYGSIDNSVIEDCKRNGIVLRMSKLKINRTVLTNINGRALSLKDASEAKGSSVKINNSNIGISSEDGSDGVFNDVSIDRAEIGGMVSKNKKGNADSRLEMNGAKLTNVKTAGVREKRTELVLNGKKISEETKDIDALIRNEKKVKK